MNSHNDNNDTFSPRYARLAKTATLMFSVLLAACSASTATTSAPASSAYSQSSERPLSSDAASVSSETGSFASEQSSASLQSSSQATSLSSLPNESVLEPIPDSHIFGSITDALVGQNYWLYVDEVWDQVTEADFELIRIGGISPNETFKGIAYYDKVIDQIFAAGAAPMIQISEQWSRNDARAFLQHLQAKSAEKSYQFKYFGIGNEPDHNLRVSKLITDANGNQQRVVDVDAVIAYYNEIGPIIREYFPSAVLIGPCWANFYDGFIRDYYLPFIAGTKDTKDANGNYILNVFSFHTYASTYANGGIPLYDLTTFEERMALLLPTINQANQTRPNDQKLSWAVTELHTTYNNDEINVGGTLYAVPASHKTYSFYAGQYFAQIYGYAMTNGAFGITPWSLKEGETNRNFGDLGIFEQSGTPRSTYHHTQMLTKHLRQRTVEASASLEGIEVIAMDDETGTSVMLMNTQEQAVNFTLSLNGVTSADNELIITVNADTLAQEIQGNLAGQSTHLYVFAPDGTLIKRMIYNKSLSDSLSPPTTTFFNGYSASQHVLPGRIEAESYSDMQGMMTELTNDLFGGSNLAYVSTDDFSEYAVSTPNPGLYRVRLRVASPNGNGALQLTANGAPLTDTLSIPATGDWQNWRTLYTTVYLPASIDTLGFKVVSGGFNINWLQIDVAPQDINITLLEATQTINKTLTVRINTYHPAGVEKATLYIDNDFVRDENIPSFDWYNVDISHLSAGEHTIKIVAFATNGDITERAFHFTVE